MTAAKFIFFLLNFDAHSFSHAFEDNFDGLNNFDFRVGLANTFAGRIADWYT